MKLKLYHVDAFAENIFSGNPAAVCPLTGQWPEDSLMLKIANENNLSETAFYLQQNGKYHIRWFTPAVEVALCGHATLASAFVLFHHEHYEGDTLHFESKSGTLSVKKEKDFLTLDFPTDTLEKVTLTDELKAGFNLLPIEVYKGKTDYLFIYSDEDTIKHIKIDLLNVSKIQARGVIVSAKGKTCDFVTRFFAPQCGVNEDPVTGSAFTTLTPYWSRILNKKEMTAVQLSARKGYVVCRNRGNRTEISGKAKLYMQGEISL